jgi:hypothetical protein
VAERSQLSRQARRLLLGAAALVCVGALGGLSMLPFRFGLFATVAGHRMDLGFIIAGTMVAVRGIRLLARAKRLRAVGPA